MLKKNFPFQLRSFKQKGHLLQIDYETWTGNSFTPGHKVLDTYIHNIPENVITSINQAVTSLKPFLMFVCYHVPSRPIIEFVHENYEYEHFEVFQKMKDTYFHNEEQMFYRIATFDHYASILSKIHDVSISIAEGQSSVVLSGKSYIATKSMNEKTPPINLFNSEDQNGAIGMFYYEALAYELRILQNICFELVTKNIYSEKKQLDLFKKGKLEISYEDGGESSTDDSLPFEDIAKQMEKEGVTVELKVKENA